jgi:hypothetical protein
MGDTEQPPFYAPRLAGQQKKAVPVCNPIPPPATIALDLQRIAGQNERCVAWPGSVA